MKRYLAFYGDVYHAVGGMSDFIGDFDTKEAAIKKTEKEHLENRPEDLRWEWAWCSVWDSQDRVEVHEK